MPGIDARGRPAIAEATDSREFAVQCYCRAVRRTVPCAAALAATLAGSSPAQAALERYALSMFHFNVQYVAGGLVGFPGYLGELRPEQVEDLIVTESLAPVLEMYAAHPTWGANIEMQGYLLDVLASRHPETFALLRDLALSGQIEVVSFHYSDQFFVAFPQIDWERSQALTEATFAAHDVPLGRAVFCQEGQSGMGLAQRMAERDYQTMVWPKNLWIAQHGDFAAAPLYRFGDVNLVAGAQGASYDDGELQIETTWTFFDDGELLATNDWNPYFPEFFVHTPAAVAEYEAGLEALDMDGWVISTVSDYVDAIADRVEIVDAPPLLDGTWQPGSTNGVAKWMGDRSVWLLGGAPADRDNHVRTLHYAAHRELVAAEAAAAVAGLDARAELDAAWRLLAMGEVSDSSGINPYRGEVEYGLAHGAEVLRIARGVIERAKTAAGLGTATIDPAGVTMVEGAAEPFVGEPVDAGPIEVVATAEDAARAIDVRWERIAAGHHRVWVEFGPGDPEQLLPAVAATFTGELVDELVTTLALVDDAPAVFSRADFTFGEFKLALPLGVVSVAPGVFVIKDTGHVHLAAGVRRDSGDVTFRDETQQIEEGVTWGFHVFEGGADDAVALARRINGERQVVR